MQIRAVCSTPILTDDMDGKEIKRWISSYPVWSCNWQALCLFSYIVVRVPYSAVMLKVFETIVLNHNGGAIVFKIHWVVTGLNPWQDQTKMFLISSVYLMRIVEWKSVLGKLLCKCPHIPDAFHGAPQRDFWAIVNVAVSDLSIFYLFSAHFPRHMFKDQNVQQCAK